MKLSIVIPTRNRAAALQKTLARFCEIVQASPHRPSVEIVCVDNFSRDSTAEVGREFSSRYEFVRYFHQAKERHSAETSALHAIDFARGEYIWLFGDDDEPAEACVDLLAPALDEHRPGFALLNFLFAGGAQQEYINSLRPVLYFSRGVDLFRQFGLKTATTTLSCLCFRREGFQRALFEELASVSEIYSHSVALFANFYDAPAIFVAPPLLKYFATPVEKELANIAGHSQSRGQARFFSFALGIVRLAQVASRLTGVPMAEIQDFTELGFDKRAEIVRPLPHWSTVVRAALQQHEQDPEHRFTVEEIAELRSVAAQLSDPAATLCWEFGLALDWPNQRLDTARFLPRLRATLTDCELTWFQRTPWREPVDEFETLYFQKGVVPVHFPRGTPIEAKSAAKQAGKRVVIVVPVEASADRDETLSYVRRNRANLRGVEAQWALWIQGDDRLPWQHVSPAFHLVGGETLPLDELERLGDRVVLLPPRTWLFPAGLLFGLNLLAEQRAEVVVFNTCHTAAAVNNSSFLGDEPRDEVLRNVDAAESVALAARARIAGGDLPFVATVAGLRAKTPRVIHFNGPLAGDCHPPQTHSGDPELRPAGNTPPADSLTELVELARLTLAWLREPIGFAPASAATLHRLYVSLRPAVDTELGAAVIDNLSLLLAIRCSWENRWRFVPGVRQRFAVQLQMASEALAAALKPQMAAS